MARSLVIEIIGDSSSLDAALGKSAAAATGFGDKLQAAGAKMTSVGKTMTRDLTLPIVAVAAASTKMALDFSTSMELIRTQAGGTQSEVDKMSAAILKMVQGGHSFGQSATDMAKGLFFIESEGIRGAQALEVLRVSAAGAAVGQTSLANTSTALTSVMKVYKMQSDEAAGAMATLNAVVGAGKMHMEDLNAALGTKFLPTAKQMGFSLAQAGAALDVFTQMGVPAQVAATNLTTAFIKTEVPTKAGVKALADMGVSAASLHEAMGKGLPSVLDLLSGKLTELGRRGGDDIIQAFGGSKSGASVLALVQQYKGYLADLGQVQKSSSPATFWTDVAAAMNEPKLKIESSINSLKASMIEIGAVLAPIVAKIASAIADVGRAYDSLGSGGQTAVLIIGGVAAAIGPLITVVGGLTTALGFLIANPIVLVIAGLVALGAAIAAAVLWPDKLKSGTSARRSRTSRPR